MTSDSYLMSYTIAIRYFKSTLSENGYNHTDLKRVSKQVKSERLKNLFPF